MTDKLQTFVNVANSTLFNSRDIIVDEENKVKLGNMIFSEKASTNVNTLKAFREAMSEKYGVFGEHAFDTVLNSDAYAEEKAEGGNRIRSGNVAARMGNEVMLDPKDIDFKAE